ncbi:MAG: glycosyltransferase family 2 protein [Gemmatimonadetes bacterium]|nr:MAG: glycosyltransferase family 2 protein [Gemmatimonadota bacterium]
MAAGVSRSRPGRRVEPRRTVSTDLYGARPRGVAARIRTRLVTAADRPTISIVLPCRNEERYIGACLDSILATTYPLDRIELLVVDGESEDRTREIVAEFVRRHPGVRLLENRRRITPAALNVGLRAATGEIILRMDAHVVYPINYIPRLVDALLTSDADNVGGIIVTLPADGSTMARAIAVGLSHPFGVGNAYFRIGVGAPRWVDSVPFGCFRREVFDRIGLFDEELIRNQDDEFNLRLIKFGGRILLLPDVVSYYFARRSLSDLSRMYYQYGYYKPLVARKVDGVMTLRQLVPGLFVLTLAGTAVLAPVLPLLPVTLGIAGAYLTALVGCVIGAVRRHGWRCALALAAVFPAVHFSYGIGSLRGAVDHLLQRRRTRRDPTVIPLSR